MLLNRSTVDFVITFEKLGSFRNYRIGAVTLEPERLAIEVFETEEEAEALLRKQGYERAFNEYRRTYDWYKTIGDVHQIGEEAYNEVLKAKIYAKAKDGSRTFNPYNSEDVPVL